MSASQQGSILPVRLPVLLSPVTTVLIGMLLIGAASMDDDAGLISVGLDGQAGQADTFCTSSEIRAGAISADGRHVVFSSLADNLTLSDASRRHHRR